MMTYDEMKEIAERYGIGISQSARHRGGFIDSVDGDRKASIMDGLQSAFGIPLGEIGHMY